MNLSGPAPPLLSAWAGGPTSVRRRALNRVLLALPLATRRRFQYLIAHGRLLNLSEPKRWTEKINWRMVHDRRDLIAMTCDKLASREFVMAHASPGTVRLPRAVWSGDDMSELALVVWPARWVFKSNHGTGAVVMGQGSPDRDRLTELTDLGDRWLRDRGPERWGEWGYSRARRLVLIEEAIPGTTAGGLPDYKFFVAGGQVKLVQVDTDRFTGHRRRFYTATWQPLAAVCEVPVGPATPAPPHLVQMVAIASQLGAAFDFIRIDLYDADGSVWFGELTAYSGSGLARLHPTQLDDELGAAWTLPQLNKSGIRAQ